MNLINDKMSIVHTHELNAMNTVGEYKNVHTMHGLHGKACLAVYIF